MTKLYRKKEAQPTLNWGFPMQSRHMALMVLGEVGSHKALGLPVAL